MNRICLRCFSLQHAAGSHVDSCGCAMQAKDYITCQQNGQAVGISKLASIFISVGTLKSRGGCGLMKKVSEVATTMIAFPSNVKSLFQRSIL